VRLRAWSFAGQAVGLSLGREGLGEGGVADDAAEKAKGVVGGKASGKRKGIARGAHVWYKPSKGQLAKESKLDLMLGCVYGRGTVDPAGLPYALWMELPKRVSWALGRACVERDTWAARGKRFEELMLAVEGELTLSYPGHSRSSAQRYMGLQEHS
jgi:hypothetical protein